MRILFIKLSSMGDIVHALASITDAVEHASSLEIDWVIDTNFQDIAKLHPHIQKIILTDHRHWRKKPFTSIPAISRFIKQLRLKKYDLILDGQTNWKSALISLLARGKRVGLDKRSCREYIAHFAYQIKHTVSRNQHAVEHLREFFSLALGYPKPKSPPNFSIHIPKEKNPLPLELPNRYYACIHAASWKTKLWPAEFFARLIQKIPHQVVLFWGSEKEKKRAEWIAEKTKNALVLPKLSLIAIAKILSKAEGVVSVDTGLGQLAGALNRPLVGIHGPTDPKKVGSIGKNVAHIHSSLSCFPCHKQRCLFQGRSHKKPACLEQISPETVWKLLQNISI